MSQAESAGRNRPATLAAIGFGIASALLFAFANVALRFAGDAGALHIALIRSLVFVVLLAPFSLLQQAQPGTFRPMRTRVLLALFTGATFLNIVTWLLGVRALSLATATSLLSLKAQFSVLGAAILLKERVSARRLGAVCIGFIGGAILLNPGEPSLSGAALVLGAAASSALSGIFYAQLVREHSAARVLLVSSVFQLLVLAPFAAVGSAALPPFTLMMAGINAVGSIGVMCTLACAYRGADVGLIASLEYLRLPFAAGLGFLFFAERPTPGFFVGSAIIIIGAALANPLVRIRSPIGPPQPLRSRLWKLR